MTLSFHPDAIAEYREAALRYEKEKSGLGGRFVSAIEAGVTSILENPTRYGPVQHGVRRYALKEFPYRIHFVYDETRRHVTLYAVMHVRRDPDYWRGRLVH